MSDTTHVSFDDAAATTRIGTGRHRAAIPDSWTAGGRAPGGLIGAHLLSACIAEVDDDERRPISATTQFLRAPDAGDYEISTETLRRGRSTVNIACRAVQNGSLVATAQTIFGVSRPSPEFDELPMPIVGAPTPGRGIEGYVPEFARPYRDRIVVQERLGPAALSGSAGPMVKTGWAGFARPRAVDALGLAMMADVGMMPWWVRLRELQATAALECSIQFRADLDRVHADDLVLIRSTTGLVRDGFLDWDALIWAPDGTLLCQCRQLLTVLGPVG